MFSLSRFSSSPLSSAWTKKKKKKKGNPANLSAVFPSVYLLQMKGIQGWRDAVFHQEASQRGFTPPVSYLPVPPRRSSTITLPSWRLVTGGCSSHIPAPPLLSWREWESLCVFLFAHFQLSQSCLVTPAEEQVQQLIDSFSIELLKWEDVMILLV